MEILVGEIDPLGRHQKFATSTSSTGFSFPEDVLRETYAYFPESST